MSEYSNPKGIIAETYVQLQSLELITLARARSPVSSASEDSFLLAVLQASEIAILNLSNLLTRTILDVRDERFGVANTKMGWVYGYNAVLTKIASLPGRILTSDKRESGDAVVSTVVSIEASPNFQDFYQVFVDFDTRFLARYDIIHANEYNQIIGLRSFDNDFALLLHLLQISNYCTSVWESRLSHLRFVAGVASYDGLVHPMILKDAVLGLDLSGDTFFTQFRGLHQIPEILTREANEHMEHSINRLREDDHLACYSHLRKANLLLSVVVDCLEPISVSLSTSDYHDIRENLGLTSGSHSENLHYHLFRDLYPQLCNEFLRRTFSDDLFVQVMRDELFQLHHLVDDWRVKHINFPQEQLRRESDEVAGWFNRRDGYGAKDEG